MTHCQLGAVCVTMLSVLAPVHADDSPSEWFAFKPTTPVRTLESQIDLRWLNEEFAGQHGRIEARDGRFYHHDSGEPVRFWAVNGPPHDLRGEQLEDCARMLAKYGVNLVRIHGAVFDERGEVDRDTIRHAQEVVRAMKAKGIYSHFSIYFPLWFTPPADLDWLSGYDGQKHPFATLMFNEQFQQRHQQWLEALLMTPDSAGQTLINDPAVMGVEIQNEDSFFFWTFDAKNIPEPQLEILEAQFGQWLIRKYGSLESALHEWQGVKHSRDAIDQQRIGFRPLWNIVNERRLRDQDTATFLYEAQRGFYDRTVHFSRSLGYQGLITCSNWATASPERFGPLEKLSYLAGDVVDRHGYFGCHHQGENAAWSIRNGHTFHHRSALRFDSEVLNQPKQFNHPVMDPQYDDRPSMISETTFTRPNRYRSEAPLFYACYGSLQDTDSVVHFALDGFQWEVKPRFWMQQWTLASPAMMGQFPAAAFLYRRGLVEAGPQVAKVELNVHETLRLEGTPLPQDASFDELRLQDVPDGESTEAERRIDPRVHFVGRTGVQFTDQPSRMTLWNLAEYVDNERQQIRSATGQLQLDYGRGLLTISAPAAQGISGDPSESGPIELPDLVVQSSLDLIHLIAVSLDEKPLRNSDRILLQVMTEEQPTEFEVTDNDAGELRITNIGQSPWLFKSIQGEVGFKRDDAAKLQIRSLDLDGVAETSIEHNGTIVLRPNVCYYLIETPAPREATPGIGAR